MKQKLTEKDLTQIVKKILQEMEVFEPIYAQEKKRNNTYKIFESLSNLQSYIRNKNFDRKYVDEIIEILESEIDYLKNRI